jgi:hypothetical protein
VAVHQLFIDFKKAYDSVRQEVLHNILTEFGVPIKLARLIKICLNETYSNVHTGKHLSDKFPIQNSLKGDASLPLLFNSAVQHAIRKVQENQVGLNLNGTHQLLVYADDVYLLGRNTKTIRENIKTVRKNTKAFTDGSKWVGLEVKTEEYSHQNAGQNHNIKRATRSSGKAAKSDT